MRLRKNQRTIWYTIESQTMDKVLSWFNLDLNNSYTSPCFQKVNRNFRNDIQSQFGKQITPAKIVEDSPFRAFCINNLSPLINFKFASPKYDKNESQDQLRKYSYKDR